MIGNGRETPARCHWFLEGRWEPKYLIPLFRRISIGFGNPPPGRDHLYPHSHTLNPEKTDHRLLSRSKGGSPKGLE